MKCNKCGIEHELPINPLAMIICDCGEEIIFDSHIKRIEIDGKQTRYYVYDDGRVYSSFNKKFLRPLKLNTHYAVSINNKFYYVNRLVVDSFFNNLPKNYLVKHKDGDFSNNHKDNLEIENRRDYYFRVFTTPGHLSKKEHKSVYTVNKTSFDGIIIKTFKSISEAAQEENITYSTLRLRCNKKYKPVCFKHGNIYYYFDNKGKKLKETESKIEMIKFLREINSTISIFKYVPKHFFQDRYVYGKKIKIKL